MATFMYQALHPAVRTCDAVAARLEQVRDLLPRPARALPAARARLFNPPPPRRQVRTQMAHTADLLRTRLTVQQQAQNIKELEALQANSRTQLLLQESVEGLSVVAITYYSTGVLGYLVEVRLRAKIRTRRYTLGARHAPPAT